MYAGIATHYVAQKSLGLLKDRLAAFKKEDGLTIGEVISEFASEIPAYESGSKHNRPSILEPYRAVIDRCFDHPSVPEILDALQVRQPCPFAVFSGS